MSIQINDNYPNGVTKRKYYEKDMDFYYRSPMHGDFYEYYNNGFIRYKSQFKNNNEYGMARLFNRGKVCEGELLRII